MPDLTKRKGYYRANNLVSGWYASMGGRLQLDGETGACASVTVTVDASAGIKHGEERVNVNWLDYQC